VLVLLLPVVDFSSSLCRLNPWSLALEKAEEEEQDKEAVVTVPLGLSASCAQRQPPSFFPAVAPAWWEEEEEVEEGRLAGRLISSGRKRRALSFRLSFLRLLLPLLWLLLMLLLLLLTWCWCWCCFFSQHGGEEKETENVPLISPPPPRNAPKPTPWGDDKDLIIKHGASGSFSPPLRPPPPFLPFIPPTPPPPNS